LDYESIKGDLGKIIAGNIFLTRLFFFANNRLFLRARYVRSAIREIIESPDTIGVEVLDAGCGYGQYSYFVAKRFPESRILSAEIMDSHVENFRRFVSKTGLKNISVEKIDLTMLDLKDKFNLAVSVDVMEHIEEDVRVFENIYGALKEAGVLLIHTPHISDSGKSESGSFHDDHVREGYGTKEILDKLKKAGFEKTSYILTYGKYGQSAWRLLQKLPLTILSKSKLFYFIIPVYFLFVYPIAEFLMWLDTIEDNSEGGGILVRAWKSSSK